MKIYKINNNEKDCFSYKIKYYNNKKEKIKFNSSEINELKNKILISSTTNTDNNSIEKRIDGMNKRQMTNIFVDLIENIQRLTQFLNRLIESGYPLINNLRLQIKDSKAFETNNPKKNLKNIMESYNDLMNNFIKIVNEGYQKYPLLRLFYGKSFIKLYSKITNQNENIYHIVNSVILNKIKNLDIHYKYISNNNIIENICNCLSILFRQNNCVLKDIYKENILLPNLNISSGLYKIENKYNKNDLNNNLLNLFFNLTGKAPIINTLLFCNEETSIEEIKAFFFRAIFCEDKILFVITNLERLQLVIKQKLINLLSKIYFYKNGNIISLLILIYEKEDSGLRKKIQKLIPDKNNFLINYFENKYDNVFFNDIELYTSKYAGYGKTTEIKYKVKQNNGFYYYLPIGGTLSKNFVINNLENLKINITNMKKVYLHLDLSETDNDDLMNEILLKLLILRYLESNNNIYYLGNELKILIEIPRGFIDFEEKYRILKLFKKIYINKLPPLRLEENIQLVQNSPISIVAETLELLESNNYINNINLKMHIRKSAKECEIIIDKYFKENNVNYYQKMNFIKILSVQFKKFHKCIFFNLEFIDEPERKQIVAVARKTILENLIRKSNLYERINLYYYKKKKYS